MSIIRTTIEDLLLFEPRVFEDARGHFFEAYNQSVFEEAGIRYRFIQDNQSHSVYGVIRGLHYQLNPNAQCKLVRVLQGRILDVAVDVRKHSPTYGKVFSVELSAENKKQLLIPHGFAHGFSVLSATATVLYKCDAFYHKESEGGIIYNDADLAIDWQIPEGKQLLSEKDLALPGFKDALNNF
ncbi:dTDP-4-dehydrorhamnose 3,5-epimerase [Niabella sp. CC-SYL272]|uniref:dTDP-4-dehydrorhamnose 3,5-epimerase n=1 Tax=Niabella agricola TaxID=2891571 RepID=UPI001F236015|nr:dTDP-4-dehydrorhamnose 3,5-epimerase [Niabella agricola]MCF3108592.1 dTDP-4-dehydrorhamnose 3,5-epimerase [Niabella agricola]